MNADGGPGRARPHAGRASFQARAGIAFDRRFGDLLRSPAPESAEQARLGSDFGQLNHPVWAVLNTVPTTDASIRDGHFSIGEPVDGIGRTVLHAMGVLAMPAGCG